MSSTPRTDAAIIAADGRWTYGLREEMQRMEMELTAANERLDSLRKAVAKQNEEISQACGKALGYYPWFKDDQKNFPGATEDCGVCVGEHVAVTIVEELAMEYGKAKERIRKLEQAGDEVAIAAGFSSNASHIAPVLNWAEARNSMS